jgi:hypothetical protein
VLSQTLSSLTFNVHPSLSIHSLSLHSRTHQPNFAYRIDASVISRDDKNERATIELDAADALALKEGDEFSLRLGWKADLGTGMLVSSILIPSEHLVLLWMEATEALGRSRSLS